MFMREINTNLGALTFHFSSYCLFLILLSAMELILQRLSLRTLLLSFLLHLYCTMSMGFKTQPTFSNETDRVSLLAFKKAVTHDPLGVLSSWNDSVHFCKWSGVTCGRQHQRITVLDLSSKSLAGPVSPYIGNLTFLRLIDLRNNSFQGEIPMEFGNLVRLRSIVLKRNSFGGHIPSTIGKLTYLQILVLEINNFNGSIPENLGRLTSLRTLGLGQNELTGMVPLSLYNISSLRVFSLVDNKLYGSIPLDIGFNLPNLWQFNVGANHFTGTIPNSLFNASGLKVVQFLSNNFTGTISTSLSHLQSLEFLSLGDNHLGQKEPNDLRFLTSLTNSSNLRLLDIGDNHFGGVLTESSLSNLSTKLSVLHLGGNYISGSIPVGIGNLISLDFLSMGVNLFNGSIPTSIGRLQNLKELYMGVNNLSGPIPSSLSNISSLTKLNLQNNSLDGNIPSSFGNFKKILSLGLSYNNLSGAIPEQIVGLSLMTTLELSNNLFSGPLPIQLGNLKQLGILLVANNRLSEQIPISLGKCESLQILYLNGNLFKGSIPSSLSALKGIIELDLSHNKLSGQIPEYMGDLPFQYLNLSFNDLEGRLPQKGVFKNVTAFSVFGNKNLCGGIPQLGLPVCFNATSVKHDNSLPLKVIIPLILLFLFLVLVTYLFVTCNRQRISKGKPPSSSSPDHQHLRTSYAELLKATDGFSMGNLIGSGSYGSVYKGVLDPDERVVAVKVLNLQHQGASRSFVDECNALKNTRHRNLIKIISVCSSVDFNGNDFKALIFEFMPNGNLDEWLHPEVDGQGQMRSLNLTQILHIAFDVASASDYLHNRCTPPIIHRDLKPSNILLDDDLGAHVGDFGLAKFLHSSATSSISKNQTSSAAIKGSIGYIAPEYAVNVQASTQGDVYSYGIILLELLTGKRPVDDIFREGLNIHNFAKMSLPEKVIMITDPRLLNEEQSDECDIHFKPQKDNRDKMQECLASVLKIGVACSAESPAERMDMSDVIAELSVIREKFLGVGIHGQK